MQFNRQFFAVLAMGFILGTSFGARAEEQADFPVQKQIETRTIHATHTLHLRNCAPDVVAEVAPAILFPTASEQLSKPAKAQVKKVAALLKSPAYKNHHILVSGYTDNKGKDAINQRLSYHRAVSVVKELIKDGVPASQVTAQGFGKENPAATNATASGRAQNRRVTFTVSDKE